MVVSSVSLMPRGLELWGEEAAVSCRTCQNDQTNHDKLTAGCTYPFGLSPCNRQEDWEAVPVMPSMNQHALKTSARLAFGLSGHERPEVTGGLYL